MVWHLHLIIWKEGLVQNHLISIFYSSTSLPDLIKGGKSVQNHLISIFYGLIFLPDLIKRGELVQNHLISIILLFDIFA